MNTHEHPIPLMNTQNQPRAAMSISHYHWALMSSHEHSWAWYHGAMTNNESTRAVMSMVPRGYEHSSALMSAHGTILISAPGYSWAHMSTYRSSWELTTGHECWTVSSNNKQTMLSFCSILTISHSILHRIIKNWIFLKSTWNGLWKIVQ